MPPIGGTNDHSPRYSIRRSRERAGLTQAELAARLGTTQSAVARLERPSSNRIQTVERALLATEQLLSLSAKTPKPSVDETLIVDREARGSLA